MEKIKSSNSLFLYFKNSKKIATKSKKKKTEYAKSKMNISLE